MDKERLVKWFESRQRELPWRKMRTPYAVWISEVMLQQTQVSVVIPYFERWMERFPTIHALSESSLDEVIKLWEGLGYYSRARYLHEGAKTVCQQFDGVLPDNDKDLSLIKGLGIYTRGAIRSFAFHQKTAAVDGNVLRVITRYFAIEDDIAKSRTANAIRERVETLLPEDKHWVFNEALIELGATVCMKKANCFSCPLQRGCESFRQNCVQDFPFKSTKHQTIPLFRKVAVLEFQGQFLVKQEKEKRIMQGLYEFPYFETHENSNSLKLLERWIKEELGLRVDWQNSLPEVVHSFTKYRVRLEPESFLTEEIKDVEGYEWKSYKELHQLAFSSGHKRILNSLMQTR